MESASYPSVKLATPYGVLEIFFLDPDSARLYAEFKGENYRYNTYDSSPEFRAIGELTINGIALKIQEDFCWRQDYIENASGDLVPSENKTLRTVNHYNRRADLREWDWSAGYAKKLRELFDKIIPEVEKTHANLKIEAKRVTLFNLAIQARKSIESAELALVKANAIGAVYGQKLLDFNKENP